MAIVALSCAPSALAQCLSWEPFPASASAIQRPAHASIVFDDGSGAATYFGGYATDPWQPSVVSRWNGTAFEAVGTGLSGRVNAFAVYDHGSGPALYAGGDLVLNGVRNQVARWDGAVWQSIGATGSGRIVYALRVHDDGSGPALFVGGDFPGLGGVTSSDLIRWNGAVWSAVGGGFAETTGASWVNALEFHDDGAGPALFVGGHFTSGGGVPMVSIARWNGSALSAVGTNFPSSPVPNVRRLESFDDGTSVRLVASGADSVSLPNTAVIGTWNGTDWTILPNPSAQPFAQISALAIASFGGAPQIVVLYADSFGTYAQRWNGASWSALPGQLYANSSGARSFLAELDLGSGPRLSVSDGIDAVSGGAYAPILAFDGAAWVAAVAPQQGFAPTAMVRTMRSFDDGSGPALYVGGRFPQVDGVFAVGIARRRGTEWEAYPPPRVNSYTLFDVLTLEMCDVGAPRSLYVGGDAIQLATPTPCNGVATWDGFAWRPLSSGLHDAGEAARALLAADLGGGTRLFVGGSFLRAGSVESQHFAAWTGSAWAAIPPGPNAGLNADVRALALFDGGSGPAVYAGGGFTGTNAGLSASHIVRWTGSAFEALGSGMNGDVWVLRTLDDGSGPKLYAAGAFTQADGVPANRVARFDGTTWTALGAGLNELVTGLEIFDDGSGPALYAAGNFSASGTSPLSAIARWDGSSWRALANGIAPAATSLAAHVEEPGDPAKLFVGGPLETAGLLSTSKLAAWRGCGGTIDRFCFGDGTSSPCPCDNSSLASRGCNNSAGSGGARLNATGATNPDTIELYVAGETPAAATLVFQGDGLLGHPVPFGDGLRCVGGSLKRLYTQTAVLGALYLPAPGQPSVSVRSAQLGDPLVPGSIRGYQAWYRDPSPTFCSPPSGAAWNLSNAVRIAW